jgi:gamma-glutamylcyclotransferase (GGCT)/AIG2-like uncharacterized protein YtfP
VADLAARLPGLDREEWCDPADETKSLYVRRAVPVHGVGGQVREAWVYAYNERFGAAVGRGPRVESGDWRAHLASASGTHTLRTVEDPR